MDGIILWFFRMLIYLGCLAIIFGSFSALGDGIEGSEVILWLFLWNAMVWVVVGFEGVMLADHGLDGKHWTTRVYWITSYLGIGLFMLFFMIPWGVDFS